MVLIVTTVLYPHGKAKDVGKKYIEVLKKFPPDRSLAKTVLVAARATKDGIKVIGISDVKKGKYKEALIRLVQSEQEYTDIEGFTYEIETYLDITEAMPIVGLEAPEDR
ncbi:MAG: hypothetical protein HWN67_00285 [Candidatus Helarchaeota archaeon]|nr:hypothetical protein [Candidatus Helarchaeota archaeon]